MKKVFSSDNLEFFISFKKLKNQFLKENLLEWRKFCLIIDK